MRLSQASYYADFYVYPVVAVTLSGAALALAPVVDWPWWLASFLFGLGVWTLAEYLLHRYVLHHVPWIHGMHEAHHDDQMALIGTPTWLSLGLIGIIVLLPGVLITDFTIGSGLTVGLMLGYLWYVTVHHGVHHWKIRPDGYFYRLKRRHALHHHFDDDGNFGVTSGFWDKVFGTDIRGKRAGSA